MLARAGDREFIEQLEKCGAKLFQKIVCSPLGSLFTCPCREGFLRTCERVFEARNTNAFAQPSIVSFSQKINLIAKVLEVVIYGRCGKEKHLRLHALLDDVLHQALVAASTDNLSRYFVTFTWSVISEIVGFIDYDEIEIFPIESAQFNIP